MVHGCRRGEKFILRWLERRQSPNTSFSSSTPNPNLYNPDYLKNQHLFITEALMCVGFAARLQASSDKGMLVKEPRIARIAEGKLNIYHIFTIKESIFFMISLIFVAK